MTVDALPYPIKSSQDTVHRLNAIDDIELPRENVII
jgi:hypothetical protein